MAAAIKLAIKNATTGLSDQVKNLLTAPGTDLDTQLQKAQAFQAVMKEAADASHPLAEALRSMNDQFAQLKSVFDEASATEEQYAQLTKYETEQRKALIDAFGQYITENFTSDAEKLAKAQADVTAEMGKLGLASVTTKEQFVAVTKGIDFTTDAGIALYESLVKIAPEFLQVANAAEQATAAAQALAEAEAQRQAQLSSARQDLQIQLLEAMGNKTAALAMQRERELAAMDASLRPLQELVWATQDHAAAVNDATNVLAQAYQRQRAELQATANKFEAMTDTLRSFRQSLYETSSALSYAASLANLKSVGTMAGLGDEKSINALPGVSRTFLDAAKANAKSSVDYQRDVGRVAGYVDKAIASASSQASAAEQQLKALDDSVKGLLDLNTNVVTVKEAIENLQALLATPTLTMAEDTAKAREEDKQAAADLLAEITAMRDESKALNLKTVENTAAMARVLARLDGAGVRVFNDSASPIYTSAV
jgi:hypothetical protein